MAKVLAAWILCVAPAFVAAAPGVAAKAQLEVTLAGGGELAYFVPEVERALAEHLRHDGVVVLTSATDGAALIATKMEERPGDRVLFSAQVRGHQVDVEGDVESIDALVDELATRLAPLCQSQALEHHGETSHVPLRPKTLATEKAADPHPPEPPKETQPKDAQREPAKEPPPKEPPAKEPPPPLPVAAAPPVAMPVDPYGPDARVADAPAPFVRGRVVVHTFADPPEAPAGTGSMATQALYATLQRRLHLSIVPMGVGMSSPGVAAEEGARSQSRVVVMGRLDSFSIYASATGPVARLRVELSAVREGRLIMRRVLYAETPAGAISQAVAEGKRGRLIDPVYLAVTRALESELGDLQGALVGADAR